MNLEQRIQAEKNRVSGKIEELNHQNVIDLDNLKALKEDYNSVLFSANENDIDYVNSQIKEVSGRINRRNEKVKALQENNPLIQSMISEEMAKWLNEVSILEEQAAALAEKLEPKQKELLAGLDELVDMKYRVDSLNSVIRSYGHQLNESNSKRLGINGFNADNKVLNTILPLLVEHRKVFKAR